MFSIKATKSIILVMRGMEQGRPSILDFKGGRKGCTTPPMRPFHPAEPGPKAGRLSRGPGRCPLCPAASLASAGTQATCPFFHPFYKYLLSSSHCREGRMGRRCQEGNQTRQERRPRGVRRGREAVRREPRHEVKPPPTELMDQAPWTPNTRTLLWLPLPADTPTCTPLTLTSRPCQLGVPSLLASEQLVSLTGSILQWEPESPTHSSPHRPTNQSQRPRSLATASPPIPATFSIPIAPHKLRPPSSFSWILTTAS